MAMHAVVSEPHHCERLMTERSLRVCSHNTIREIRLANIGILWTKLYTITCLEANLRKKALCRCMSAASNSVTSWDPIFFQLYCSAFGDPQRQTNNLFCPSTWETESEHVPVHSSMKVADTGNESHRWANMTSLQTWVLRDLRSW